MYMFGLFLLHRFKRTRAYSYNKAETWHQLSPHSVQYRAVESLMDADKKFREEMTVRLRMREHEALVKAKRAADRQERYRKDAEWMKSKCMESGCWHPANESGFCAKDESIYRYYGLSAVTRLEDA